VASCSKTTVQRGDEAMKAPSVLRRKGVREALERFVGQVAKLPEVEAILLVAGDEGWEVLVVLDQPDLTVVDAVAEAEGRLIDELGELPFLSQVLFRQGQPLEHFLSPSAHFLFRR